MNTQGGTQSAGLRNKTLADYALLKARESTDDIAIYLENDQPIRYGPIFAEAMKLAAALHNLGLKQGDVISFQLPNWRETLAIDIAASWLGLVVNPVIPIYRDRELGFILSDAATRLIFIPSIYRKVNYPEMLTRLKKQLPQLEHIVELRSATGISDGCLGYEQLVANAPEQSPVQVSVDADSTKLLLYTSGTTGHPKAVKHSHNSLSRAIDNGAEGWGLTADDVMLMPSPVTHVTGFANGIELPFLTATKTALMERWDVDLAVAYITKVGATACVSATPFLQELVEKADREKLGLPSLRFFACGGASVPPGLIYDTHRILDNCRAFRVYGCTEAPLVTVGFIAAEQEVLAATTDGRILNWDVRIIDESGVPLAVNQDGEVLVKGPALMQGYGEDAQTADAIDRDGYFHTGDIGHVTEQGAIVITDRKKDIIIRGGENLSAREIEDVIHQHEQVSEVAAVAMPHERLGEGVCVFLVTQKGALLTLDDLMPTLQQSGLAKQKWPERIELLAEMPKTASGKIRKDVLRKQLQSTAS
jgi:acyl-CoA synthetase (AMP-forming)/AMP-acid ligase II